MYNIDIGFGCGRDHSLSIIYEPVNEREHWSDQLILYYFAVQFFAHREVELVYSGYTSLHQEYTPPHVRKLTIRNNPLPPLRNKTMSINYGKTAVTVLGTIDDVAATIGKVVMVTAMVAAFAAQFHQLW